MASRPVSERTGSVGDYVTNRVRSISHFFVEMSSNTITIPIGLKAPGEFLTDLHHAITEAKLMIFERRVLDLDHAQTYALYILTDLQARLIQEGGQA